MSIGYLNSAIQLAKSSMYKVDEVCSIRQRTWNIATYGVVKATEIDKHYEVHQFFAEAFYTGCTALLKAGIAYSEAPGPAINKDC
jgi:hypothetical protein